MIEENVPVQLIIYPLGNYPVLVSDHEKLEYAIREIRLHNTHHISFYMIKKK